MGMLLYLTGLVALCTGIYLVRKSEKEQNAITNLVFTVVLFMVIQATEAGIINIIPILKINAVFFGAVHIIEGIALWYLILIKKKRQKYYFNIIDVRALSILAVLVVVVAIRQFGLKIDDFNFELSDSARHLMYAKNVANYGQLTGLYFSSLNSGLIMNMLHGIIDSFSFYKIFISFEIVVLFLNGAMFWVLIRRYLQDKFSIITGTILAAAYMLGYPWNSMVFGTAYLSTGILCVAMIMVLMDAYLNDEFQSNYVTILLVIASCYALLRSYSVFLPPVLIGIILLIVLKYIKNHTFPVKKFCIIGGIILGLGLLVVGAFLYFWLVKGIWDKELASLSWWGYIYGTLYADFLFAIPFCILWLAKSAKLKIVNVECTMLFVIIAYILVFFLGNCFGKISAYYYYKVYYILWIAVFMAMLKAIIAIRKERDFMLSYIFTWGLLFLVFISSAEKRIAKDYNLDLTAPAEERESADYFSLYHFNLVRGHDDTISKSMKDLYMEAAKLSIQNNAFIPYIGEYAESEWTYFALAGIEHKDVLSGKNYAAAVEELKQYPYILSVECEEPTADVSLFLNTLPVIYENESGKIYKVENMQTESYVMDENNIDIILRYGFPKLERMGWVEQDEYVNSLQVIQKIDMLGLDKRDFLYPELEIEKIKGQASNLADGHYNNRKEVVFTGTTSEELQQMIDSHQGARIVIHSNQVHINETIILRNNTAIDGNGVKLELHGLEYGFIGEGISDIYLHNISIEGKAGYGIYLADCNEISISKCKISGMQQKAVCIIGDTNRFNISSNEMQNNSAGGLYIVGNASDGLIEMNQICNNIGASKWMSGITMTSAMPDNKYDIWDSFDSAHNIPQREDICSQISCPHDIIIRNNSISQNSSVGIYLDGAYKCYIINNRICQNAKGGIELDYGTLGAYLADNFIEHNGVSIYPGISMDNTAYDILKNNIIREHSIGINMMCASVRNLIMENSIYAGDKNESHQYGIRIGAKAADGNIQNIDKTPGYENILCRNCITGNYYSGIFIDEGCYVNDVFDNIIMGVQAFSVETISSMFNSIVNNTSSIGERNEYKGY